MATPSRSSNLPPGNVVELFAGVGGFRLGLEGVPGSNGHRSDWQVTWANQWEPSTKTQHAADCYIRRFGEGHMVAEDIAKVLDWALDDDEDAIDDRFKIALPDPIDLLVGGFPCQDYSVAKPLSQADGIEGQKGVLWWQIHRLLEARRPQFVLLENVDRLLKSPASQRGRDFAVMLACFDRLGYSVEWRVINAAEYGFPQRRRRIFIYAELLAGDEPTIDEGRDRMTDSGVLVQALPAELDVIKRDDDLVGLLHDLYDLSENFGLGDKRSVFRNAGFMRGGLAWTGDVASTYEGKHSTLGDLLQDEDLVQQRYPQFYIPTDRIGDADDPARNSWRFLKGAKKEPRVDKKTGHEYFYSEGAVGFPDRLDRPSRTVLTGEGGTSPSRFKHVVQPQLRGPYRRLTPVELEKLNGFPEEWTAGMSDGRRAFCMGNALVVGVVQWISQAIAERRAQLHAQRDAGRRTA